MLAAAITMKLGKFSLTHGKSYLNKNGSMLHNPLSVKAIN